MVRTKGNMRSEDRLKKKRKGCIVRRERGGSGEQSVFIDAEWGIIYCRVS
jgi:hypothetical protein